MRKIMVRSQNQTWSLCGKLKRMNKKYSGRERATKTKIDFKGTMSHLQAKKKKKLNSNCI